MGTGDGCQRIGLSGVGDWLSELCQTVRRVANESTAAPVEYGVDKTNFASWFQRNAEIQIL